MNNWVVYCLTCKKEIDRMKNGGMAEGYARKHIRDMGGPYHVVLLGQFVEVE